MSTPSMSVHRFARHGSDDGARSRRSPPRLPVAILLSLCVLSVTTAVVQADAPAWAEVMQYAG